MLNWIIRKRLPTVKKKRGTDHRPEKKEIFGKSVEAAASQMVLVVKNLPANAGDVRDVGSIPGLGRFPGGGHGNPLQNSCLQTSMDRGAWRAIVHGSHKKSDTTEHTHTHTQRHRHTMLKQTKDSCG